MRGPTTPLPTRSQPPAQPHPVQSQPEPLHPSSGERSIMDLRKLIEDFLTKVEGALHTPYALSKAQKDYEQIAMALAIIEKGMEERDMLNVSDKDLVNSTKLGAVTLEQLHQKSVLHKSAVDAEFQKISSAASAARAHSET